MTTALSPAIVIEADGAVHCCAWCLSTERLAELHRTHRCSDGVCVPCLAKLEQEIA